jgi:predicted PurR-regulated permease PerM
MTNHIKLSSYFLMLLFVGAVLLLHMAPTLLIGMLIYLLSKRLGDFFAGRFSQTWARLLAVICIVTILASVAVAASLSLSKTLSNEDNLAGLATKLGENIDDIKQDIPQAILAYIPENVLSLKGSISDLSKEHIRELSIAGKEGLHTFAHILIAIVAALLLSMHQFSALSRAKPFAREMRHRLQLFGKAFENIVFAQIKISAINTLLTGIFLLGVLPAFGIHLPYANSLVILTFFTGLLPVVGNLISNAVITVISIGVSFKVAIAALVFLVGIHKLEYFINAKIVGEKIQAAAWEILLAFLIMEACFGINGILMAPIVYAYLKSELLQEQLI